MSDNKKTVFSGIQSTGVFTLGNYLGALKNWVNMQNDYSCIYSVVDLHAITVRQTPADLRKNTLISYALLLAMGVDTEKSILFLQSHVPAHSQLAWLLNCYTQFGELSRMTQFKDKSEKNADNINAGLFTYPALMAADILLYQTDCVPVGADQKQHIELARNVAERFNNAYSPTFVVPEGITPKFGARVMSLQDPMKKMSKSDDNANSYITILDKPDEIIKKFKRAVTDSDACVKHGEGKNGINNLMEIYSCINGKSFEEIEKEFDGKGYGDFKLAVGECVMAELKPIQDEFDRIILEKDYLNKLMKENAEKANYIARKTLAKTMKKIGFVL